MVRLHQITRVSRALGTPVVVRFCFLKLTCALFFIVLWSGLSNSRGFCSAASLCLAKVIKSSPFIQSLHHKRNWQKILGGILEFIW